MAELTFKSAGVSTREIDLSGPTQVRPSGIPAGIIGTAQGGPAFVPITVATYQDFIKTFGATNGEMFGPLAMNEWMKNSQAGTYVRILGVGDGQRRTSTGAVTRAGFVVGAKQVQPNGNIGANPECGTVTTWRGAPGRTYMLGCFMSASSATSAEVAYQGIFKEAGIRGGGRGLTGSNGAAPITLDGDAFPKSAQPILRGVLMVPSGVLLSLSSSWAPSNNPNPAGAGSAGVFFSGTLPGKFTLANSTTADRGYSWGDVNISNSGQQFVMLLNGYKAPAGYTNVISASFDPKSPSYFHNVFNTDPLLIEDAGHYLYAHWNVYPQYAVVTGSGLTVQNSPPGGKSAAASSGIEAAAFLLTSSLSRNASDTGVPDFEAYENRFTHAVSPWVTSQNFGGKAKNLFKIHVLDDGAIANDRFKISIENLNKPTNTLVKNQYGTFDLIIRSWSDNDRNVVAIEKFLKLSLDPSNERYIGRIIGDRNIYYDFDKNAGAQKLVIEGLFPNMSKNIRVEIDSEVSNGLIDATALPVGVRGPRHLVTSGSSIMQAQRPWNTSAPTQQNNNNQDYHEKKGALINPLSGAAGQDVLRRVVQPPLPMRRNLTVGRDPKRKVDAALYWGTQFEVDDSQIEPNKNNIIDNSMSSWTRYFPNYDNSGRHAWVGDNAGIADSNGTVLDCDRFDNNRFTLERVQVRTSSADTPDSKEWARAKYRRDGVLQYDSDLSSGNSRFLNVKKDFASLSARKYLKFSFFVQGGFDGVNIFNEDKAKFLNAAIKREVDDSAAQGGVDGPTVQAYRRAIDVLEQRSNADIKLLAVPGVRHETVTDYAIDAVEERFDAMYIMDIEERDTVNNVVTGSAQKIGVGNTAQAFTSRNLDSSFAAAYFPDVIITDPATLTNVQCPPSVSIIGAYAHNDAVAHPWFAPAGFTRGALKSVIESMVKMSRDNLDELYEADINPITSFPHTPGVVAFGQKTLLAAQSALDRVNVRRLLISIRRRVRGVANKILFEPNRADTLAKFSAAVQPILARIQQQQGLDRFKVVIDTTTTTQADVENNTIRGKIFLQPTRAVEFISLDFVVTNKGANI
jgi:phage tail sheath protein FI